MGAKFLVRTFGCQMNEHDSERIAGVLAARGMEPCTDADSADVVVLNTCCIRENADNKLYGNLGHLKSIKDRRPGLMIAVGGCLAQKDRETVLDRAPWVDVVFGTHNVGRVGDLLDAVGSGEGPAIEILEGPGDGPESFASSLPSLRETGHSSWVTIQVGCDNSCAFCIVPSVRGREVSRPVDEVVSEVAQLAGTGVSEVTLLGQNVNSYGRDITGRRPLFAELLAKVSAVSGVKRVRFTSPHPKDLRPETIDAMASVPAVCEHLHLPLQSGSDRVLAAMHRGYNAARYLDKLRRARNEITDLAITTDLIVGFPGETEEDFQSTLEVAAEAAYDGAYTFIFSPRPGTEAARMSDRFVPAEVTAERFARLKVVVERSALSRHEARVGRTEEVLVDGPSKRDAGTLSGRTRQNKLVHFAPAGREVRAGDYVFVTITGAAPHFLRGELVVDRLVRRRRLPVVVA